MAKRICALALALLVAVAPYAAAGKKKKKAKPYKSEEVTIAVAHPVFYGNSGEVGSVTAQEFENTCAEPASQGLDAWVFEVPGPYRKTQAIVETVGTAGGPAGYDLDMFFYDSECTVLSASQAEGTDETGYAPEGTAWILVHNYLGDPNTSFHIEVKAF